MRARSATPSSRRSARRCSGAIIYITLTLLYYDLRIRKEAFDLQQRVSYVDPSATPGPVDWAGDPNR